MFQTFIATLSPMLTMFLLMATGFFLQKKKIVPENTGTVLAKLETNILIPAVTFSVTLGYGNVETYRANLPTLLYGFLGVMISIAIASVLVHAFCIKDKNQRGIYRYSLAIANTGFMGNAIVPMILGGDEALFRYCLYCLPINLLIYSWGVPQLIPCSEGERFSLRRFLNPAICAWIIGFSISITGINRYIPDFAMNVITSLKACMGPLAMVLTGCVIAGYSWKEILSEKKVYFASLLRLLPLPTIILCALYFLGCPKEILPFALIAFACPLGLNTVVYPASYGGDTKTGAGMAAISHTLSVLTIPLMYALFQMIF